MLSSRIFSFLFLHFFLILLFTFCSNNPSLYILFVCILYNCFSVESATTLNIWQFQIYKAKKKKKKKLSVQFFLYIQLLFHFQCSSGSSTVLIQHQFNFTNNCIPFGRVKQVRKESLYFFGYVLCFGFSSFL